VAAQDGGSSLISKLLAGLGALATLISLARDMRLGEPLPDPRREAAR
jgi:hypothetical protein